jgi:NAD(P)-dependent dehydrogenase (short-subunit alcohol dehydrogenase family)
VIGASRRGTGGAGWTRLRPDVDSDESVTTAITGLLQEHGLIDALVAAAGWGLAGPVETTSIIEAKAQLATNF